MIVLDTTVLAYAVGTGHRFRDPSRQLVEHVREGRINGTTTLEVIQEFAHVRAKRRGRGDAADLARDYMDLLSPLLVLEEKDLDAGLALFEERAALGSFDAVLAAAARTSEASALVSADSAFSQVPRLTHIVPDEAGIAALLELSSGR